MSYLLGTIKSNHIISYRIQTQTQTQIQIRNTAGQDTPPTWAICQETSCRSTARRPQATPGLPSPGWLTGGKWTGGWLYHVKYKYEYRFRLQIHRWMVTNYLPVTYPSGLTSSVLGLSFLVLAEHFRGPERELWATCRLELQIQIQIQIQIHLLQGHNASYQGRGDACGAQPAPWWPQPP